MRAAVSAGDVDAFLGPDDNNDSDSSDGEAPPILVAPGVPGAMRREQVGIRGDLSRAQGWPTRRAIREAYARGEKRWTPAPSGRRRRCGKKSEHKGCGGTRPEARNTLLEPLGDGSWAPRARVLCGTRRN